MSMMKNIFFCFQVFNSLCEIRPYHAKYEIKQNISELLSTNPTVNAVETGTKYQSEWPYPCEVHIIFNIKNSDFVLLTVIK